jgi:hypothetical protein
MPVISTAAGADTIPAGARGDRRSLNVLAKLNRNRSCGGHPFMNIWTLAAGALTLALAATIASRRRSRRKRSQEMPGLSVSTEWLSEGRRRQDETP